MKRFGKVFLVCYIISVIIYLLIFGNLSFYGEKISFENIDIASVLLVWALGTALVFSIIISYVASLTDVMNHRSK